MPHRSLYIGCVNSSCNHSEAAKKGYLATDRIFCKAHILSAEYILYAYRWNYTLGALKKNQGQSRTVVNIKI